jgi:hypothetical protein
MLTYQITALHRRELHCNSQDDCMFTSVRILILCVVVLNVFERNVQLM